MAAARGSYLTTTAQASYDLSINGDQSAHDTAVKTAVDDYRSTVATAWGDRRTGLANASKTYSDAVNGTTGARVTWQSAYDAAIKDFTDDQSNERADLQIDLATLDAAYATLESQSYATTLSNLATTNPSLWATQAASEAQALADEVADIAAEEVAWRTAAANASRQEETAATTAAETLSTAQSAAAATWSDATSAAKTAQAAEEADAEQNQADTGASTVALPILPAGSRTMPPATITPVSLSEGQVQQMVGNWLEWLVKWVPTEQWGGAYQKLQNDFKDMGQPLSQEMLKRIETWGRECAKHNKTSEELKKSIQNLTSSDLDPFLAAASRKCTIRWLGEWNESDKRRIRGSLSHIRSRIEELLVEVDQEIVALPSDIKKELQFELNLLKSLLTAMNKDLNSPRFVAKVRHGVLKPVPREGLQYANSKKFTGVITFNDGKPPGPWNQWDDIELDIVFFHELTHKYGTHDDPSYAEFWDAYVLERIFRDGFINGNCYKWMKDYAKLKIAGDRRVKHWMQPYKTAPRREFDDQYTDFQ